MAYKSLSIPILGLVLACQRLPPYSAGAIPVPETSASPEPTSSPTGTAATPSADPDYLTTFEGHLRNQNADLALHGVGWWGFETGMDMVSGWDNPSNLAADFATVVLRLKLLGFNAVRLPMSFSRVIKSTAPQPVATPCSNAATATFIESVLDTGRNPAGGFALPVAPQPRAPNMCNDYVPTDSALHRYAWLVQFLAANGFFVLLDDHVNSDSFAPGSDDWVANWVLVAQTLLQPIAVPSPYTTLLPQACRGATSCAALPAGCTNPVCEHVMFDFISTAHSSSLVPFLSWDTGSPGDAHHAYLAVMDAVYPIIPHALFFVEGAAQPSLYYAFGTGVSLDPTVTRGGYDPHPFFDDLVKKPYVNQVVLAPTVFGPSITLPAGHTYSDSDFLNQLHLQFDAWRTGYPTATTPHIFPIVPVAFGANFNGNATSDEGAMAIFADFINNFGVDAWFYWAWPPTGSPQGFQTTPTGWAIDGNKMNFLQTMNLRQP